MTDPFAEGPVHEQGDGAPFVIRLSKTAGGSLTYTIGASLDRTEVPEAVVDALFSLRDLVEQRIAGPVVPRKVGSLAADLRKSLIVEFLKGHGMAWQATDEIVSAVKGHRSQVVADLKVLVKDGIVEYKQGKGGLYPSRYRLAQKGAKA